MLEVNVLEDPLSHPADIYTFVGHLKWTPAITLGYAASIDVHIVLNRSLF
ncbi:MAG: hypothetical protein WC208_05100 [Gallionella sp.]